MSGRGAMYLAAPRPILMREGRLLENDRLFLTSILSTCTVIHATSEPLFVFVIPLNSLARFAREQLSFDDPMRFAS